MKYQLVASSASIPKTIVQKWVSCVFFDNKSLKINQNGIVQVHTHRCQVHRCTSLYASCID